MLGADDVLSTAENYHRFARFEAAGKSPLCAALCEGVAGDAELLAFLSERRPGKRQPNLLLAAVRLLFGLQPTYAAFRAAGLRPRRGEPGARRIAGTSVEGSSVAPALARCFRVVHTLDSSLEPDPFSSHWENGASVRVLVVRGRVDAACAPHLSAAICTFGRDNVVVDLGGVHAIDTGALCDVLLAARVVGIALHLARPDAALIQPLLDLALVGPVTLHASRAEAVFAAVASSRARQRAG